MEIFWIEDNIWSGDSTSWDIKTIKNAIVVSRTSKKVSIFLKINPPTGLEVVKLDMIKNGAHIIVDGELKIGRKASSSSYAYLGIGNFRCVGAECAISLDSREFLEPRPTGLQMIGGQGIVLSGTGISLGIGAPSMTIAQLKVW